MALIGATESEFSVPGLDHEVNNISKLKPEEAHTTDSRIKRNQVYYTCKLCGFSDTRLTYLIFQIRSLTRALHDVIWKFSDEEEQYKERCKKKITDYLKIRMCALVMITPTSDKPGNPP